jgi:cell division protein FtsI (penicillin-binding protein 3)
MKIKNVVLGISFMLNPFFANAQDIRGSITTNDNRIVVENIDSDARVYPYQTTLEPLLGYVNSKMNARMGLEKYAELALSSGTDVKLTVDLELQQQIELILDSGQVLYEADEIIAAVMESGTGKILVIASSNRYDPSHITQNDIPSLIPKFASYPYEPGSVIKPLTLAIALDHEVVEPTTVFNTYEGRMELGNDRFITDDEKFDTLNATDIIVHSSNIGISQIAWRLTGKEFKEGLKKFGLGTYSGIELPSDKPGKIKSVALLDHKLHRANTSYGYGMLVTFTQLLKAYSSFNNDGIVVTPQLMEFSQDKKEFEDITISKKAASQIYEILIDDVQRGIAKNAQYDGLEVGGKTGTAHIAKYGYYVREYHSSFYGFANDNEGHKYTIGVVVIRAKAKYAYFASQSAVPVFGKIVDAMVKNEYLKPSNLDTVYEQ